MDLNIILASCTAAAQVINIVAAAEELLVGKCGEMNGSHDKMVYATEKTELQSAEDCQFSDSCSDENIFLQEETFSNSRADTTEATTTKTRTTRKTTTNCFYLKDRNDKFEDMLKNQNAFNENFHMESSTFFELLGKVKPLLAPKRKTRPKDGISPTHKLAVVLEYFAGGTFQRRVASRYRISKQKFGVIIDEVCNALCQTLQDEIPPMTPEEMRRIANSFTKWNFPNCLGAIDCKQVAIKCSPNSGQGMLSLVLVAAADGDYRFVHVDIDTYGSEDDTTVFDKCTLRTAITNNKLTFPKELSNEPPFVFLAGDASLPLHCRIMKPFKTKPGKVLENVESIFNYRLNRARRCVENAFGLMCSHFPCMSHKMNCGADRANRIIKTCIYLHNYLIRTNKEKYSPPKFTDYFSESGALVDGEFRQQLPSDSLCNLNFPSTNDSDQDESGHIVRHKIANYFILENC